jgi:hypothetical protein
MQNMNFTKKRYIFAFFENDYPWMGDISRKFKAERYVFKEKRKKSFY